jgi:hypothetical protein
VKPFFQSIITERRGTFGDSIQPSTTSAHQEIKRNVEFFSVVTMATNISNFMHDFYVGDIAFLATILEVE